MQLQTCSRALSDQTQCHYLQCRLPRLLGSKWARNKLRALIVTWIGVVVGLISSEASAGNPPGYHVELLGPATVINDMNNAGEIVGWVSAGGVQAFVAGPQHEHELLPLPAGYSSAWAQGINDAGVVVGSVAQVGSPEFGEAVAWYPDGNGGYDIEFLGALSGHTQSVAYAINNRGDIVGVSINPGFQGGPTVWFNSPDSLLNITAMGAPTSPKDINDQGVVIGINGPLFDIDTLQPIALPEFQGNMSGFQGWGLNNSNELAGTAFFGGVSRSATRWTAAAGWEILGGVWDISSQIIAYDINDSGTTVMETAVSGWFSFRPAVHIENVGLFPLEDLLEPGEGNWAFVPNLGEAVNNLGQIGTIGIDLDSGESGIAILTPVDSSMPGDANGDGIVGVEDLLAVLSAWGPCNGCPEDFDNNGTVDVADLLTVLANWT